MKNYFSLNQKVSHQSFGNGIVIEISKYLCSYPIQVQFEGFEKSFTFDGKYQTDDKFASLSQQEHIPIELKETISFEAGELVWVSFMERWEARYYSHFDSKGSYFFGGQKKEGYSLFADEIRKFSDNPLI